MVILVVATIIAVAVINRQKDWAYGAVVAWAYAGILIKHLDPLPEGFGGQHIGVIVTVSICLGFVAAASLLAVLGRTVRVVSAGRQAPDGPAKP